MERNAAMIPSNDSVQAAFRDWSKIPGLTIVDSQGLKRYTLNTLASSRHILGAIKPITAQQIPEIVRIASQHGVPLSTISTGRNWGYGSALSAVDHCVILDLGQLNKILHFDPHLGTVTVEPGVTQQQLYDFISKEDLPFMVPTTGAGPSCSLLANALEKGYGITPNEDHFGSLLHLKAVMADGSLYQSTLEELGGHRVGPIFKWKLGPYLDGLFAQSHFGIVTQGTLALARRPENVTQFFAFIEDEHFEDAVVALRNIKQKLGAVLGGVNLMNKRRLLAMVEKHEVWAGQEVLSESHIREMAQKKRIFDWGMLGGIYGPKELTEGAKEVIRKELRPFAQRIIFLSRKRMNLLEKVLKVIPIPSLVQSLPGMKQSMNILEGIPSQIALPLAYLKNKKRPVPGQPLSPDEDGCGLIWFSPLLPMDASLVRDFTQEVTRVCIAEGVEPLITLTGISERCFDSTIPLVFDATSVEEREKVRKCFDALIEVAREFGVFPYRMDVDSQRRYFDSADGVSTNLVQKLLQAVDPKGILSPGRYSSYK